MGTMSFSNRKRILGLALEERFILAADVHASGSEYKVQRSAQIALPEGFDYNEPAQLSQLIEGFFSEHGIRVKHAVVGIPAKRLIVREKTIPPTSPESLPGMLGIQFERRELSEPSPRQIGWRG